MTQQRFRCAIYTRKSSEEGLDQNFNSLHAQREACEAYILSQSGEGWAGLKSVYDDGGYSGGSMDRPALRALMQDIRNGLIDIVVVYKVDRLTRSLADFAKIVEVFDAHNVSFVSITQAFNTTSSMGRLTLNVLLSFAQFEREVTGERIRDKIAASKAKGLRMGGRPLLGYEQVDNRLVVNEVEAETVREIFRLYLELGSVNLLEKALQARQITSKRWMTKKGVMDGGSPLRRGALYHLLRNPTYLGIIQHKEKRYEGCHPAIIDVDLWERGQAMLDSSRSRSASRLKKSQAAMLVKILYDDRGHRMVPVHTRRRGIRYRYYVSSPTLTGRQEEVGSLRRIAAGMIEDLLIEKISKSLAKGWLPDDNDRERVRQAIIRTTLGIDQVLVNIHRDALVAAAPAHITPEEAVILRLPFHMHHRQGAHIIDERAGTSTAARRIDRALLRGISLAQK